MSLHCYDHFKYYICDFKSKEFVNCCLWLAIEKCKVNPDEAEYSNLQISMCFSSNPFIFRVVMFIGASQELAESPDTCCFFLEI